VKMREVEGCEGKWGGEEVGGIRGGERMGDI
jgi:hypothetical protein